MLERPRFHKFICPGSLRLSDYFMHGGKTEGNAKEGELVS